MARFPLLCSVSTVFLVLTLPAAAHGQWVPDGNPVCTAPQVQRSPDLVPDGNGGAVVFWVDRRNLTRDLYAARITAAGALAPGWPQDGLFLAPGVGELWRPMGAPDGTGGAIIVWEDDRDFANTNLNIYAQRVTGDGAIAPGWPAEARAVCTARREQRAPRPIPDGAGGAIIAWYDNRDGPDPPTNPRPDIYAQHLTANGEISPGWPADGVAVCTAPDAQYHPTLASDGAGGAIISWFDFRTYSATGGDIYAQRLLASGQIAPGWVPDGVAISTVPGDESYPQVVADGVGGALLIWKDRRADLDADVYASRITAEGALASGWRAEGVPLCTVPRTQQWLRAVPDGLGGAVVCWEDYRTSLVTAADIYAQRVTGAGVVPPGWPPDGVPVCTLPSWQIYPELASDGAGGAYVVWQDYRAQEDDIYAQHVLASGAIAPGWDPGGTAVSTARSDQYEPTVAPDGLGGAITAWMDARNGYTDIYAHKLGLDGPVPALLSLLNAETFPQRVVLTWYGNEAASTGAIVYRRTALTDWVALGSPVAETPDRLRLEDTGVTPGERYAYRLGYRSEGMEQFTAETWVEVPRLTLRLLGFRPNPAAGGLRVSFSLPSDQPATLEVFASSGRRVLEREVGGFGVGDHLLDLGSAARLPPGVYWIRLRQSGASVSAKGVVTE